jgi:hypothetical protein
MCNNSLDKQIELAAWRVRPFTEFRLSRADCERLNAGLTLLREREAVPRETPPAIADAIQTWKETRRL